MRRTLIASLVVALATMFVPSDRHELRQTGQHAANRERGNGSDIVRTPPDVKAPDPACRAPRWRAKTREERRRRRATIRTWLGLDDVAGGFYTKNYQLRGMGKHIEVWTATGHPDAQRRHDDRPELPGRRLPERRRGRPSRTRRSDYLIDQFDNNIYPIESERLQRAARPERRERARSRRARASAPTTTSATATTSSC